MTQEKTPNKVLMKQAREALSGKWGLAIGTLVVYLIISIGVQIVPFIGSIALIIIGGPLMVGLSIFLLSLSRNNNPKFEQLFKGFENFGNSLGAYILFTLFIFLWTLLLIIPGIIAAFAYSQTFFILAEDKSIGPLEAITKSKKIMKGNKWKFFCLMCRFIGWALLCILTLGIGFLWLSPYIGVSYAKFYDDIKN